MSAAAARARMAKEGPLGRRAPAPRGKQRLRLARTALALAAASAHPGASCGRGEPAAGEPPPRSWPPGTVLAIDGEPISAGEVDLPSAWVERIEPGSSSPHLRRLALTNVVIPRRIAATIAGEARERALAQARQAREGLAALPQPPPGTLGAPGSGSEIEGGWSELGIVVWGTAMDLAQGPWSDVVEDIGRFVLLRRLGQEPGPVPGAIRVRVELLEFPYLPGLGLAALEQTYGEHRLEIVDPAWREIVPEHIQYKMGVHQP